MGICLSCEGGVVPRASELGLPRNFTVLKELGAGGEGRTYLIRERLENGRSELFAAKVAARGPGLDVNCLLQGIRNQCALSHVNIVRLLEVILTHSHVIIKLEYARGGELSGGCSVQWRVLLVARCTPATACPVLLLWLVWRVGHALP
ncbi:unnamed protein product [Ostreobium quekettii]|uniref:Protein kinase domain-containing protein n=1 Tax=Ostreobium quekettii TaxID=121088 RepID=A0A8S1IQG8_9CHLO|nr:unnamed protein product [Ostreobium quekettii]